MKMTLDETEILEEITYISAKTGERIRVVLPGGSGAKHEALLAEELTSSSLEERKCFVIRSVVDKRDDSEISLREALSAGVIDPGRGVYVNLSSGKSMAIPLAMSEGLIKVEYVSTKRSAERTEAVGLITIRTQIDHHEYLITGAFDALTGERVGADEARRRGLINEPGDWYLIGTTGERLPLIKAIDQGWVFASDAGGSGGEPTYEVHTYAVREVRDHARQVNVNFAEAVLRGLIDRETGDFVNNLTGERLHVVDAIQKGSLQAKLVEDVAGLHVSPSNAVIVDRIQKINRRIIKGTQVIAALQQAGKERNQ